MDITISTQVLKIKLKTDDVAMLKKDFNAITQFEVRRGANIKSLSRYIQEGHALVPSVIKGTRAQLNGIEYTNLVILDFDGDMSYKDFRKQWYFKYVAITYSTLSDNKNGVDKFRAIIPLPGVVYDSNKEYSSVIKKLLKVTDMDSGFDNSCLQMSRKFYPGTQYNNRFNYVNYNAEAFTLKELKTIQQDVKATLKLQQDTIELEYINSLKQIADTKNRLNTCNESGFSYSTMPFPDEEKAQKLFINEMKNKYLNNYVAGNRHNNRYSFLLALGHNSLRCEAIQELEKVENRFGILKESYNLLDTLSRFNPRPAWMHYMQLPEPVCENVDISFELPVIFDKPNKIEINKKFLNSNDIVSNTKVTVVVSTQGSGKTTSLKDYHKKTDNNIITIAHRKLLTKDIASGLGIVNYTELSTRDINKHTDDLSITIQSLAKLDSSNYKKGTFDLVIDEYTQLIPDLNDKVSNVYGYLKNIKTFFNNANKILLLDATYDEQALDVLLSLIDNNKTTLDAVDLLYGVQPVVASNVTVVINKYQPKKNIMAHIKKQSFMDSLVSSLNNNDKVVMPLGNKTGPQGIATMLERLNNDVTNFSSKKYLTITGSYEYDNNGVLGQGEAECANLLKNLNDVDVFMYTSAMFTGVNIPSTRHNFDRVFGFYPTSGMFDAQDIIQSWNRCRDISNIDYYTPGDYSYDSVKMQNTFIDSSTILELNKEVVDTQNLIYRKMYYKWQQYRMYNLGRVNKDLSIISATNDWLYTVSWLYTKKKDEVHSYTSRVHKEILAERNDILNAMQNIKKTDGYIYARCVNSDGTLDSNEYRLLSIKEKAEVMYEAFNYDGMSPVFLAKSMKLNLKKLESFKSKHEYAKLDFDSYKKKYKTDINSLESNNIASKLLYSFISKKHGKILNDIKNFKMSKADLGFLKRSLGITLINTYDSVDWLLKIMRELLLKVPTKRNILIALG